MTNANKKAAEAKTATHTPGPWFIQRSNAGDLVVDRKAFIQARPGCPIVTVNADSGDGDENVLANARLIAAAPDLLNALEDLDRALIQGYLTRGQFETYARAAIAKARG